MDHQAFAQMLGNYGEFFGSIAVFATLAYLVVQVRQNNQIALSESVWYAAEARLNLSQVLADHAGVWIKGLSGEPLPPDESIQFENLAVAFVAVHLARWYRSVQLGTTDPNLVISQTAMEISRHPGLLAYWHRYDEEAGEFPRQAEGRRSIPFIVLVNEELARLNAE